MSLTDELPSELMRRLQDEADQQGVTLIEYITRILQARAGLGGRGGLTANATVTPEEQSAVPVTLADCFPARTPPGTVEQRVRDAPDRGSLRERTEPESASSRRSVTGGSRRALRRYSRAEIQRFVEADQIDAATAAKVREILGG